MIGKRTIRRGGLMVCLACALMMTSLACQPSGNSAPAPSTNKPTQQKPENKPSGQPKPDPG